MEKKWRRIGKGETIPTSSIIRPINGGLPNITGSRVMMGQDCYYLSVDDAYELLKGLPLETEAETKERNDATIIKKLIGLVKETDFLSVENRASLLDWLEKQGEQKPVTDFSDLRIWKYIVDAVLTEKEGIGQYLDSPFTKEVAKKLQKRFGDIDQKSNELPNGDDYGIDSLWHAHRILEKTLGKVEGYQSDDGILEHECAISAVKKLYEQNSVWSEEDDRMMNDTLAVVDWYAGKHRNISVKVSNWLKLLKSRVLSLSLREFDKEEGSIIDHLIAICDDAMCYDTFAGCSKKDIEKYKNFLTNLKFGIEPQKKQ